MNASENVPMAGNTLTPSPKWVRRRDWPYYTVLPATQPRGEHGRIIHSDGPWTRQTCRETNTYHDLSLEPWKALLKITIDKDTVIGFPPRPEIIGYYRPK